MKIATVALLGFAGALVGCQTDGLTDSDHRQAEYLCRQEIQNKRETRPFEACVAETLRNYQILNNSAAARVASQPATAGYVAPAPAPPDYTPPQPAPNILPPVTRCQSVPAGGGTVQTTCR
jgi:hypothetical protein